MAVSNSVLPRVPSLTHQAISDKHDDLRLVFDLEFAGEDYAYPWIGIPESVDGKHVKHHSLQAAHFRQQADFSTGQQRCQKQSTSESRLRPEMPIKSIEAYRKVTFVIVAAAHGADIDNSHGDHATYDVQGMEQGQDECHAVDAAIGAAVLSEND